MKQAILVDGGFIGSTVVLWKRHVPVARFSWLNLIKRDVKSFAQSYVFINTVLVVLVSRMCLKKRIRLLLKKDRYLGTKGKSSMRSLLSGKGTRWGMTESTVGWSGVQANLDIVSFANLWTKLSINGRTRVENISEIYQIGNVFV